MYIIYLLEGIVYEIQEWSKLAENNSFGRTIPFDHESNFFSLAAECKIWTQIFKSQISKWEVNKI